MPSYPINVTTVAGKGSPLNAVEFDSNLIKTRDCVNDLEERKADKDTVVSKSGDTINGNLTVNGAINGTAVTQNSTDTTSGRLLKTGDFGIGNGTLRFPTANGQDFNDLTNTGFYGIRWGIYTGTLNTPPSYSYGNLQVIKGQFFTTQIYYPHLTHNAAQGIYYRVYYEGVWQPWIKLYSSKNIIGTVSQSGGVPTGAIIETGSNANGEYVKYADGTLICTKSVEKDTLTGTLMSEGGRYARLSPFPASFATCYSMQVTITEEMGGEYLKRFNYTVSLSEYTPQPYIYWKNVVDGTTSETLFFKISIFAIGRWY